jgi:hypothetical protein
MDKYRKVLIYPLTIIGATLLSGCFLNKESPTVNPHHKKAEWALHGTAVLDAHKAIGRQQYDGASTCEKQIGNRFVITNNVLPTNIQFARIAYICHEFKVAASRNTALIDNGYMKNNKNKKNEKMQIKFSNITMKDVVRDVRVEHYYEHVTMQTLMRPHPYRVGKRGSLYHTFSVNYAILEAHASTEKLKSKKAQSALIERMKNSKN